MKLIILIMIVGCAASLPIYAQPRTKGSPAEIAKKQGDEWQKRLNLTDDEKAKFIEAKTVQLTKLQGLERSKQSRTVMQSSAIDFENSLKTSFSPEHFEAWKKTRAEMKKNRQDRNRQKGSTDGSSGTEKEEVD